MFEWLQGDPVNGMLTTIAFFTFLILGRQLRLRQLAKKQQNLESSSERQSFANPVELPLLGNSPLCRLDARVKLICAVFSAFAVIALTNLEFLSIPIVICAVLALTSKASLKGYLKRFAAAFFIALTFFVVQIFTGSHSVATVPYLGWYIYQDGISFGTLIIFRVLAATSILNLVITVTPMETLLDGLAWFHIPSVLLDTTMLMWRYISVVSEERTRIYQAQKARCGYTKSVGIFRKLGNYGIVGGMLLVKSFDRAIHVGNAMVSRGYTGSSSLFSYSVKPFGKKETAICIIVIAGMITLLLLNYNII
jgi:cobalt ECF transporter T component CbiQ